MKLSVILFFISLLTLVGCTELDENLGRTEGLQLETIRKSISSGEQVYNQNCQHCHDGAVGKAPHRVMLSMLTAQTIVKALDEGVMESQAISLSAQQRLAVAEYISNEAASPRDKTVTIACKKGSSNFDYQAPPDAVGWGFSYDNQHSIPAEVAGVDAGNISNLQLKWAFEYPDAIRARSQPTTAAGAIFVGSNDGTLFALDQDSGCMRWSYKASAEIRTGIVVEHWLKGDTSQQPKLFFGDVVGYVYAVNAVTGELQWRDRPVEHHSLTITAAPLLYENRLYVPLSSHEAAAAANPEYVCCTFRGGIAAYDTSSGKKLWLTHTIEIPTVEVGKNSIGTPQLAPSGAPIWAGLLLDEKRRLIYAGTGENYSSPADDSSDAVIAFNIESGKIVWKKQLTANDAWNMGCETEDRISCPSEDGPDSDIGAAPILATSRGGVEIILVGQKSGMAYGLDPENSGNIVWQTKVGRGGIQGGVHFGIAAQGNSLFVPIADYAAGSRWPGVAKPGISAVDIGTGEILWQNVASGEHCDGIEGCSLGISASPSVIPGAVLAGSIDGHLRAYDIADGNIIWDYDTTQSYTSLSGSAVHGGSIGGANSAVFKNGMMFVNSGYGMYGHMPGNVLLAFELNKSSLQDRNDYDE